MVQSSEKLIQHLEKSLKLAFRQPSLRLTRPSRKSPPDFYVRLGEDLRRSRLAHEDDGSEPIVMEIMTPRHSTFWFTFVAAFRQEQSEKPSLQHASLPVFHDIAGDLVPLFRAEWDQVAASCKNSTHAQPHWHFVQRPARIERVVLNLMRSSRETIREFVPDEKSEFLPSLVDFGRFHFAMTSLWEKTEEPPYKKRLFDTENFPKWFDNLTKYIAGQVEYLVSHMPEMATPTNRVFEPTDAALDEM